MNNIHSIGDELAAQQPVQAQTNRSTSVTSEARKLYAHHATKIKNRINELGGNVSQRQERMHHINDVIAEINNLTDDKNGLDISKHTELQKKLQVARDLGANIPDPTAKQQFSGHERERLVENLHLAGEKLNNNNKSATQEMEKLTKDLDRILMMLKEIQKDEDRVKKTMISGMR